MDKIQSPFRICLCTRSRHGGRKGFHPGLHQHPFFEIGYVAAGQCTWTLADGTTFRLGLGNLLLLPPGTLHREDMEGNVGGKLAWVGFEAPEVDLSSLLFKKIDLSSEGEALEGLFRWIETEWNSPQLGATLLATRALEMLLLLMQRAEVPKVKVRSRHPVLNERQCQIVLSATSYFEHNLSIPRSVEQIARYHSVSVSHFSHLFRKWHGQSPREFVQKLRLQRTGQLLATTELSLKEIADQCGYVDSAHFCKHFKQETGFTPGDFRRQQRGESA